MNKSQWLTSLIIENVLNILCFIFWWEYEESLNSNQHDIDYFNMMIYFFQIEWGLFLCIYIDYIQILIVITIKTVVMYKRQRLNKLLLFSLVAGAVVVVLVVVDVLVEVDDVVIIVQKPVSLYFVYPGAQLQIYPPTVFLQTSVVL